MAFNTIDPTQIEVGKAVRKELWDKTKDNQDDLDSRTSALEATGQKIVVFNDDFVGLSQYANGGALEQMFVYEAPLDISLITAEITVISEGVSGTTEADIRVGANRSSLSSVFSVRPSVAFGAGDEATSSNQIFAVTDVDEGQLIVFDFLTLQSQSGRVHVKILAEPR